MILHFILVIVLKLQVSLQEMNKEKFGENQRENEDFVSDFGETVSKLETPMLCTVMHVSKAKTPVPKDSIVSYETPGFVEKSAHDIGNVS
jgi:hypothetical protein